MFKSLKINTKLVAVFLLVGLIPLGTMSFFAINNSKSALEKQAFNQLVSLCTVKKTQVEGYFRERLSDVQALAGNPIVVSAVQDFEDAILSEGADSDDFRDAEESYAKWLERYKTVFGYSDLYLVSAGGTIVYSIDKGPDFTTNLVDGQYSRENIGDLFKQAQHGTAMVDIADYTPNQGAPASFVGAPIHDGGGDLVGEVILQIPLGQLNKMMQESSGLGQSGETYLVGKDLMMRSDSRFSSQPTMLKQKIETSTCQYGLAGETEVDVVAGYRGRQVLSASTPLTIGDMQWCLMAELDESEALADVSSLQLSLIILSGVMVALLFVFGAFFARSISRPIIQITQAARHVSTGDLEQRLDIRSQDELGALAGSFGELIEYMKSLASAAEKIAHNDLTVSIEPRSDKDILGMSFRTMLSNLVAVIRQLGEAAAKLVSASTEISTSSDQMSQGANSQAHQISQVATAI
ncbi:MAG: HAMP domain-containing protein, partial [candidate division Zixibacteria bacterium]|nr:HAMP domain-containing protein [candidate division Zixibacteria bacterium]